MKHKKLTAAALLTIGLMSIQSHAVTYAGTVTMHKSNGGIAFTPLRPKSTHFCFLTKVEIEETDTGGEWARCRVYRSSGSDWFLEARLGTSSDADARCSATCYRN